jgi:amino acid permease
LTIESVCHALPWVSAGAGFIAAILWFIASVARIRFRDFERETKNREFAIEYEGVDILETAKLQTWWNMWAAIATGISVALQAFSMLCPKIN